MSYEGNSRRKYHHYDEDHRKRRRSRSRSRHREDRYDDHKRSRRRDNSYYSEDDDDHGSSPELFDFSRHKSKLSRIFFRDEDLVVQGSKDYEEFWQYLAKYQALARKKLEEGKIKRRGKCTYSDILGIPNISRPEHSVRFFLKPEKPKDLLNRIPYQDREGRGDSLDERKIEHFRTILTTYINFLQKEKFSKLRKLRSSQASLPIADYKSEILRTVADNQVVIVAAKRKMMIKERMMILKRGIGRLV